MNSTVLRTLGANAALVLALAVPVLCLAQGPADAPASAAPEWVQRTGDAIERGAQAAAKGIERGAKAAEHGIKVGVQAAARGIERGARATARAADAVARRVEAPVKSDASAPGA